MVGPDARNQIGTQERIRPVTNGGNTVGLKYQDGCHETAP
jgi:hypothetical protein